MVVKVELTEIWNHVMDWIYFGSGWVSLADLRDNGNEGTAFINGKEFLDEVTEIKMNNIHLILGENPCL
jgi:hypothetical protein